MARTERAQYTFVVKEFGDGTPWITLEPSGAASLSILAKGPLAFHLKPGLGAAEAEEIVRALNEHVVMLSFTDLSNLPHAPGVD